GSTRKPRLPRMLQINALRRRPRPMVPPLLRLAIDLFLPSLEQPLALRLRAVFREIIVDQLDLGELGSLGRQLGLQVGRHLELLVVGTDLLGRSGQRPVDELLGVVEAARALDDAERADLVSRALARGLGLDGETRDRFRNAVVQEADADRGLAPSHGLDGTGARARVLVHVLVLLLEVPKRLVLPEELDDGRDGDVGGARGVGVRDPDRVLVLRLREILPAGGRGELSLLKELGIVAKAESSRVNAHRLVARLLGLSTGPVVQLVEVWRLVRKGEILFGSLKMRIARAAEPDVPSGIGGLPSEPSESSSCSTPRATPSCPPPSPDPTRARTGSRKSCAGAGSRTPWATRASASSTWTRWPAWCASRRWRASTSSPTATR